MVLDEWYKYKARTFQTCSWSEICAGVISFSFTWVMGEDGVEVVAAKPSHKSGH